MWTADTRFGDIYNLQEFITPNNMSVRNLSFQLTQNKHTEEDKVLACWNWVVRNVDYPFNSEGQPSDAHILLANYTGKNQNNITSLSNSIKKTGISDFRVRLGQDDFWAFPAETLGWRNDANRRFGDCENTSFLLVSLLRNFTNAYTHLGVLGPGYGHAWVTWQGHILETTLDKLPSGKSIMEIIGNQNDSGYQSHGYFNDEVCQGDFSEFGGLKVEALNEVERVWGISSKLRRVS